MARCRARRCSANCGSHLRLIVAGSGWVAANILPATLNTTVSGPNGRSSVAPGRERHHSSTAAPSIPPTLRAVPVRETLFQPDSVTWRVNQEPALLLGGGRALLMQLAHPGVAAGVAEHSDFRQRPVERLLRTLELTLAITFGTRTEALNAAHQINVVHQRVRGNGYSATDPRL